MKTLMVVFGVMIMFVFVILDPLTSYLGGGRAARREQTRKDANEVAVSWDGGSLTNAELDRLVMRRQVVNSFIRGIAMTGFQMAMDAGAEPRELKVVPLIGASTREEQVEQSVVQTMIFAQAARDAGMTVTEEAIGAYLDELGGGRVTRDQMSLMLKQLGGGGVPVKYVLDSIREEMLAHNFLNSYFYAFLTATPEELYEDWRHVNDRIVIEAAPVPAESFLVNVPEPSSTELAGFFNEYREREPSPSVLVFPGGGRMEFPSPTPGFRVPREIDVQFIEANYDEFLAKVEAQVTEEEIAKYYEENKDPLFIKADTDLIDDKTTPEQPADAPAATDATQPTTDAATPATGATQPATDAGDTATDSATESTTDAPAQSGESRTGAEPAESITDPVPAQDTQPPTEEPQGESTPAATDQFFIPVLNGVFGLTALLQEPAANDAAPPAATSDNAAQPADTNAAGASTERAPTSQPAAEFEKDTAEKSPDAKPVEYQTLDEVRDQIRRDLARGRATDQLDALMADLQSQLNTEWTKYFSEQLAAQAEERAAPAPPAALADLKPLAEKHGLKVGKTGPMSYVDLRVTPVGQSGDGDSGHRLADLLFGSKDVDSYQPVSTKDSNANRYVAMKTSDAPGRIPELADVRDEVLRAWKLEKAAELAEKYAKEQATKAKESGKPLAEFFTGGLVGNVVRTDPFALYTGGDVAYATRQLEPFRLSEPDGIVAAGPEFMDKVFQLKPGEVTAVLNHDHSIAYVVRLVEHQYPPEELHTAYLAEAGIWPGMQIMATDRFQRLQRNLAAELVGSSLKWERTPDQIVQDEEG
jgi:hypothetical protein